MHWQRDEVLAAFGSGQRRKLLLFPQRGHLLVGDLNLTHSGPAGIHCQLRAVLLRVNAERRRLHAHRQVLGDHSDVVALFAEVRGHGEDAGVVVVQPEAARQHLVVGVVELHAHRAAGLIDADRLVELAVHHAQVVQHAQRRPREIAQFRMVAFRLELRNHHHRQHHRVFGESLDGARVRQQDGRVKHVGLDGDGAVNDGVGGGAAGGVGHAVLPAVQAAGHQSPYGDRLGQYQVGPASCASHKADAKPGSRAPHADTPRVTHS